VLCVRFSWEMDLLASKIVPGEISWQRYYSRPASFYFCKIGWRAVAVYCCERDPLSSVWMAPRKNSLNRAFYRRLGCSICANHLAIIERANGAALEKSFYRERDSFHFRGGNSAFAVFFRKFLARSDARSFPDSMSSTASDGAIQFFVFTL
jgi:hypothetical protein